MANNIKKYCHALLFVFILTNCVSNPQTSPVPSESSVSTPFIPIQTATVMHPTPTHTVVPATLTPYPTLIPSDVTRFIDKLASTDQICLFPCWGGILPGETNWNDIQAFLESFAKVRKHSPSSPRGYAVDIPLSDSYPNDLLLLSIFLEENDIVKYIVGWRYNLSIAQLLKTYGEPEEVYLYILGVLPSDTVEEFRLLVSYKTKGFFIVYIGDTQNQPSLDICLSHINAGPYFWLWNPKDNDAMNTIVNGGSAYYFYGDWSKFQEISIATSNSFNTEWFYKTYSDLENINTCLQVPSPYAEDMNPP